MKNKKSNFNAYQKERQKREVALQKLAQKIRTKEKLVYLNDKQKKYIESLRESFDTEMTAMAIRHERETNDLAESYMRAELRYLDEAINNKK